MPTRAVMPPYQDDTTLTDLRIAVARLEARFESHSQLINEKLDKAVVSREHLEERLGPLTDHMNRWRGGLAVITFVAGSIGAVIATLVKRILDGGAQ